MYSRISRCGSLSSPRASRTTRRSVARSSWPGEAGSTTSRSPLSYGRARRARWLSMARLRTTVTSQPRMPSPARSRSGAWCQARRIASWTMSSARCTSPPSERAATCRSMAPCLSYTARTKRSSSASVRRAAAGDTAGVGEAACVGEVVITRPAFAAALAGRLQHAFPACPETVAASGQAGSDGAGGAGGPGRLHHAAVHGQVHSVHGRVVHQEDRGADDVGHGGEPAGGRTGTD